MGSLTPEQVYKEELSRVHLELADMFEGILARPEFADDDHRARLDIVNYTMGYMGTSYGVHIPE